MSIQPIRFFHRGQVVAVDHVSETRSVLDWLREDARCNGTKEGCNEGDCGACTVVIGEVSETGSALTLHPVNACIQFLPTLHGKALFTVEDLKTCHAGALHPVQQALVDCHGSQCGFCTPGFAMSMWSVYAQHPSSPTRPTRQQWADALSGNLCRCTGYRPILDAAERVFDLPPAPLNTAPVIEALQGIARSGAFQYRNFHAPHSLDALATLRLQMPEARLLAGGTDIGLWVNKQFKDLGEIIYLGNVDELKHIEEHHGALVIGAGASLESAWSALAARFATLTELWLRFASPPIRHAGTIGGNVANGSPIGDTAPVLLALDAQIELRRGTQQRLLPLAAFYTGYMRNQLAPGELVQAIVVPGTTSALQLRAYKISKRYDSDISSVCAAFSIELDGDTIRHVRLAFGGMAATVQRATQAEATLAGQPWSQATVQAAQAALALDFTPLDDLRASAAYRLQVAQNLLQRFWLETRATDPLPAQATRVWSQR